METLRFRSMRSESASLVILVLLPVLTRALPAPHRTEWGLGISCPTNVSAKADVDLPRMAGLWIVYAKTATDHTKCLVSTFYQDPSTSKFEIQDARVIPITSGFQAEQVVTRTVKSANGGHLKVKGEGLLYGIVSALTGLNEDYYILDTDYTNYATVFSCQETASINIAYTGIILVRSLSWANNNPSIIQREKQRVFAVQGVPWDPTNDLNAVGQDGCNQTSVRYDVPDVSGLVNRGITDLVNLIRGIGNHGGPTNSTSVTGGSEGARGPGGGAIPSDFNPDATPFNPNNPPSVRDNEVLRSASGSSG